MLDHIAVATVFDVFGVLGGWELATGGLVEVVLAIGRGGNREFIDVIAPTADGAVEDPSATPTRRAGRYILASELGEGRWGRVHKAYDPQLHRLVQVSLVRATRHARLDDARALGRIDDHSVARVFEAVDETPSFVVTELVRGEPLADRLPSANPHDLARLGAAAARAIALVHAAGIPSVGLQPEHVVICPDGRLVLDVGGPTTRAKPATEDDTEPPDDQVALARILAGTDLDTRPPRLRAVLTRALHSDPARRFGSMAEFADALERAGRRRRAWLWAALPLAAVASWIVIADESELCARASDHLVGIWDADRRDAMARGFAAIEAPYADDGSARVGAMLDDYAAAWIDAHASACRSTRIDHTQSEETLDLRMACLGQRRRVLDATVDMLLEPDAETALHAVDAVDKLPAVSECADPAKAGSVDMPAPENAESVAALEDALARGIAQGNAAHLAEAIEILEETVDEARRLNASRLEAEALRHLGYFCMLAGRHDAARTHLTAALGAAEASDAIRQKVSSLVQLVALFGHYFADVETATFYADYAEAVLERLDWPPGPTCSLWMNRGVIAMRAGDAEQAQMWSQRAIDTGVDAPAAQPARLSAMLNLGAAFAQQGRHAEALAAFQRAREVAVVRVGEHHPTTAIADVNLGTTYLYLGDSAQARAYTTRALEIRRAAYGENHYEIALVYQILALIEAKDGNLERAEEHMRTTVALLERTVGSAHPSFAIATSNLGDNLRKQKRYDEALLLLERGAAVAEAFYGPLHRDVGRALIQVGEVEVELGHHESAVTTLRRALSLTEGRGKTDGAEVGRARFALARAVWASRDGADGREEARALASEALTDFGQHGRDDADDTAVIARWLREHPP